MEYIHVLNNLDGTKTPSPRGSSSSPFEHRSDDPNAADAFGADQDSMFIVVLRTSDTLTNTNTETLQVPVKTDGFDGEFDAIANSWNIHRVVVKLDLETAKVRVLDAMQNDRDAALESGYAVGAFVFPLNDEFFGQLVHEHTWMNLATNSGAIAPGAQLTFSDMNGSEVSVTLTQLRNNLINYGVAYKTVIEIAINKKAAILAAASIPDLEAITWSF